VTIEEYCGYDRGVKVVEGEKGPGTREGFPIAGSKTKDVISAVWCWEGGEERAKTEIVKRSQ